MSDQQLTRAQNIMRRMPPSQTMKCLAGLTDLCPDITDDLLTNVDQPLAVKRDPVSGKDFLVSDYNRDGDSHRSPWSNKYFDEKDQETDGFVLPSELRQLEVEANAIFDVYRRQYFDTGISSVYFFESNDAGSFGATYLIHKEVSTSEALKKGAWDSVHVFGVAPGSAGEFAYTLTSSVIIAMNLNDDTTGDVDLSGTIMEQVTKNAKVDKFNSHIFNMGTLIEEQEGKLRNKIESIYIQKTREVLAGARSSTGGRDKALADIAASLAGRGAASLKKAST